MRRFFYGVRVHVLTLQGIPVEFCLVPGSEHDSQSWQKLPFDVAPESTIYMDAGYTDYQSEDDLFEAEGIIAKVQRKTNSKRKDEPYQQFLKEYNAQSHRNGLQSDQSQDAPLHPCSDKTRLPTQCSPDRFRFRF